METVYWTEFDWQSFATIFTGLIAVGGAVVLGLRQASITLRQAGIAERQNEILASQVEVSKRQNEILAAQSELAAQSFRHDLFDLRMGIYREIIKYMAELKDVNGAIPDNNEYVIAMHRAQFVFNKHIFEEMLVGYRFSQEFRDLRLLNGDAIFEGNHPEQALALELKNRFEPFLNGLNQKLRPEMGIF